MTLSATTPMATADRREPCARILLHSDNAAIRQLVRETVGDTAGPQGLRIEWTEVATHPIVMAKCAAERFDLVVIDNETTKLGGVGMVRQMRAELDWTPTVLLLLARPQDAWLAAWSGADAAVVQPIDPFELTTQVTQLLGVAEL
ncbi:MAG: hypothetical protein LBD97_07300 [Bifidobacteriaceae bacterium]|nr:hypothetical protein [Bifidobacteriaceae bacterium]